MKKDRRIMTAALLGMGALAGAAVTGCGSTATPEAVVVGEDEEEKSADAATEEVPADASSTEETVEEDGFAFADVADREFYFSSGAGAWYTVLHIQEDGSFDGHFQDADMGATGEGYPNGTLYYSDFTGKFTTPEKVDDTTWKFQIDTIEYPLGLGEEIKDGMYYIYTDAYGLEEAEDLYMYLPGALLTDLPEEYLRWVGYYDPESVEGETLPYYGLYNVTKQEGFSSNVYEKELLEKSEEQETPKEDEASDASRKIQETVAAAEKQAASLEEKLQNAQTQDDMNVLSGELYQTWDDALNTIWGVLKENMDKDAFAELLEEQRAWISEKEAAVKEAGADDEGGSIYPLLVNDEAAKLTKARVYELAKKL